MRSIGTLFKRSIAFKAAVIISLSAMIAAAVGLGSGYFLGFRLLRNTIGQNYVKIVTLFANSIDRIITEEVNDVEGMAASLFWTENLEKYNLKYEKMNAESSENYFSDMDKKWKENSRDNPTVKEILEKPLSKRLRDLVNTDSNIVEIFITDAKGSLMASSGKTSDFYQADEEWWQCAFDGGKGKVCVEKIEFDESTGKWVLPIAIPMRKRSGEVIGVCKCVEDVERFASHLRDFKIGKTGHAALINAQGDILVHRNIKPLSRRFADKEVLKKFYGNNRQWGIIKSPHIHSGNIFVAYAKVMNPMLAGNQISWIVFVDQDMDEVFGPLSNLFFQLMVVTGIVVMINIVIGLLAGRFFTAPLKKLSAATKQITEGNWDYKFKIKTGDELEEMASSFGRMILSLKDKQTSLESAKNNLEKLSRSLEEKVLERTKELKASNDAAINVMKDLREAKKHLENALEVKSEFTSMVSHELRTPLTAIKEGINIVLDGTAGKINSEQKDFLDTAKRNVDRLARLINDVLDFQKLESGKIKFNMIPGDINEVVAETEKSMELAAKDKKLKLTVMLDKKIPKINFDRDGIIQVLTNLINNAIKFTDKGGIVITTSCDPKNNAVLVSIKDTGRGIKKEDLPRLFQRFEQLEKGKQRKTGGTGLGLVISKEIIRRHNGKIWAESGLGQGATFSFVLPVNERRLCR